MEQNVGNRVTRRAASSITGPNLCLEYDSTGKVALGGDNGVKFAGVSCSKQTTVGGEISVQTSGIAQIESDGSGTIDPGARVRMAANGQIRQVTPANGTVLRQVVGICVNSSQVPATARLLVDVQLEPNLYIGA